jgi:hypothetical protein
MRDGEDAQPPRKATLKERLVALSRQYGPIAVYTYFILSILAIIGFSIAFAVGTSPESASGVFGVIVAGWVAAKVTLPLRILITLALTPGIAVVVNRLRRRPPTAPDAADSPGTDDR